MTAPVAVIIPAYNPGTLLRRALDSVLAQTFADWQAVVVDDGSAEDLSWVRDIDPRIDLIRQANSGVSAARNAGVAATTAPLIAFLDQDDEWMPTKLAQQIAALDAARDAAFCCTEFTWVLPDGDLPGTYDTEITYLGLLTDQHVLLSSVVVRRDLHDAAGGHDPSLAVMQDYDLFLRLTMDGARPICVHEPLVRYFVHGANASANYRLAHDEGRTVLRGHLARARQGGDRKAAAAAQAGLRQIRSLYASQALQAYRTAARTADRGRFAHLARAVAWDPSASVTSARLALRRRLADRRGGIDG